VFYQFSDLVLSSAEPLPELREAAAVVAEVVVDWTEARRPDAHPTFASWLTQSGDAWLTFAEVPEGYLLTFAGYAQFVVSLDAGRIEARPMPGRSLATTRHLLLNQVLPLVLSRRGRLVLHSSAVSWQGQVIAFLGSSGAGKSTMAAACAAAGAAVVTDDCLVVRRAEPANPSRWMAVPCDAGVRLWPRTLQLLGWPAESGSRTYFTDKRRVGASQSPFAFEPTTLPLARAFQLSRPGDHVTPGPVRGRAAVMALATGLFRLDVRDASESRQQFDAISDLAAHLPIESIARVHPSEAASTVLCKI